MGLGNDNLNRGVSTGVKFNEDNFGQNFGEFLNRGVLLAEVFAKDRFYCTLKLSNHEALCSVSI
jgi:hypothetical protein